MLDSIMKPEEKAALQLRKLYEKSGCSFYRMSRFEEYDFYADKKDFLTSKNILAFTDINGKLMALRPDVTLSIIKHIKDFETVQKFYYDEKVYRVPKNKNTFSEIGQAGVEFIGNLTDEHIKQVIELALLSLKTLAGKKNFILDIADAGLVANLINENPNKLKILKCIAEKNIHELKNLNAGEKIIDLIQLDGNKNSDFQSFKTLEIIKSLKKYKNKIKIDFSAVNNLNYYNGIVFRGFIEGIPESILSGGQYDGLLNLMKCKNSKAVGFAVYLDKIRDGE